jgi:hypothetical protein
MEAIMADGFDRFLSEALAPKKRDPDRQFVSRVSARIALDERLGAARRGIVRQLGTEVLVLIVVAAAALFLCRAAPVARFFAESPAIALSLTLSTFGLLVVVLSARGSEGARDRTPVTNEHRA